MFDPGLPREVGDELNAQPFDRIDAICGGDFFDDLITYPSSTRAQGGPLPLPAWGLVIDGRTWARQARSYRLGSDSVACCLLARGMPSGAGRCSGILASK